MTANRTNKKPFFISVIEGDFEGEQPEVFDTFEEAIASQESYVIEHGGTFYVYKVNPVAKARPRQPIFHVTRLDGGKGD